MCRSGSVTTSAVTATQTQHHLGRGTLNGRKNCPDQINLWPHMLGRCRKTHPTMGGATPRQVSQGYV